MVCTLDSFLVHPDRESSTKMKVSREGRGEPVISYVDSRVSVKQYHLELRNPARERVLECGSTESWSAAARI